MSRDIIALRTIAAARLEVPDVILADLGVNPNTFYTLEETAGLLRISEGSARKLIMRGMVRAVRIGRRWRVLGRDLLDMSGAAVESDPGPSRPLLRLSETAFAAAWDNDEDAVYDL
jgi:excisionase family DNA binding protein